MEQMTSAIKISSVYDEQAKDSERVYDGQLMWFEEKGSRHQLMRLDSPQEIISIPAGLLLTFLSGLKTAINRVENSQIHNPTCTSLQAIRFKAEIYWLTPANGNLQLYPYGDLVKSTSKANGCRFDFELKVWSALAKDITACVALSRNDFSRPSLLEFLLHQSKKENIADDTSKFPLREILLSPRSR
jgi:hypothetical protein